MENAKTEPKVDGKAADAKAIEAKADKAKADGEDNLKETIQMLAAGNPAITKHPKIVRLFADKGTTETKLLLINHPEIDSDVVWDLTADRDKKVRDAARSKFSRAK